MLRRLVCMALVVLAIAPPVLCSGCNRHKAFEVKGTRTTTPEEQRSYDVKDKNGGKTKGP